MAYAYIGIGSNIDAERNIKKCINLLKAGFSIIKISNFYETKPYGYKNQPNFINLAIKIKTAIKPVELLKKLQSAENNLGKKRIIKNGPRTIDLDILIYGSEIIDGKNLTIPHKGLFERDFMLTPLLDIAPEIIDPITKKKAKYLKESIKYRQIIGKIKF